MYTDDAQEYHEVGWKWHWTHFVDVHGWGAGVSCYVWNWWFLILYCPTGHTVDLWGLTPCHTRGIVFMMTSHLCRTHPFVFKCGWPSRFANFPDFAVLRVRRLPRLPRQGPGQQRSERQCKSRPRRLRDFQSNEASHHLQSQSADLVCPQVQGWGDWKRNPCDCLAENEQPPSKHCLCHALWPEQCPLRRIP